MPEEEVVELKFRLYDGSDIGPFRYSPASTIAMLKDRIFADWPKDKKIIPKAANDIKLISAGKILENHKTVGQCRVPFGELPKGVITMHVVVQPSLLKAKTGRFHSRTYRRKKLMRCPENIYVHVRYCENPSSSSSS
ncbi:Membrane-anchored ubiquitin-fold protein 4 [Glycine max]|nr:Membrane-anchored ubiquitin-fold protein 4 [Glycine max]